MPSVTVAQWPAWQMVLQPSRWMRSVGRTTITVIDSKGKKHTATIIPLLVLPSSTTDVIVGLPHILDLFRDMIDVANTEAESIATTLDFLEATVDYTGIPLEPPPWTYGTE